jgi:hypothetical protein
MWKVRFEHSPRILYHTIYPSSIRQNNLLYYSFERKKKGMGWAFDLSWTKKRVDPSRLVCTRLLFVPLKGFPSNPFHLLLEKKLRVHSGVEFPKICILYRSPNSAWTTKSQQMHIKDILYTLTGLCQELFLHFLSFLCKQMLFQRFFREICIGMYQIEPYNVETAYSRRHELVCWWNP